MSSTTSSSPKGADMTTVPLDEPHASPLIAKDFGFLPIPKRLRYDPHAPFRFGLFLKISFAITSAFTAANLYYCQPILINLANSFQVSHADVSKIPTLVQAGYAAGLLLISPLGDLVRRRQLLLLLLFTSASLTIGLATTSSLPVFETLSFLVGVVSVVPQVLLPLAADLAPPERRASALSIVLSGLIFGILIARTLAGVIANFTSWRVIYYMALGVQYLILLGVYFVIPDCPAKNQGLTYVKILGTMAKYAVTEPKLIQAAIVNMTASACFSNFWVTLTFLLGGPPYHYSSLVIGLFSLLGLLAVATGPFMGRLIDRLVPWYASIVATFCLVVFQAMHTGAAGVNIAAVIIACFGLDASLQPLQVSLTASVFTISTSARSRLNAIMVLSFFVGQVIGSSVGTTVFVKYGWRAASAVSLGFYAVQIAALLARGPHAARYTWFGYEGGWEARKRVVEAKKKEREEDEAAAAAETKEKEKEKPMDAQPTSGINSTAMSEKQQMALQDV